MSGIAGVIRLDGGPVERSIVEGMIRSMAHRGPDRSDCWAGRGAALGQCMLCTTPQSLAERQPLVTPDGRIVLIMDGRIDNFETLHDEATALGLPAETDADLVLAAAMTWPDWPERIDGDYAIALWHSEERRLVFVRDRMGARPLYYHVDGNRIAFASELHSLLALPWVREELNEGMVAETLCFDDLSRTETFWKGILRVDHATFMAMDAGGTSSTRYWLPDTHPEIRYRRISDYAEHYRDILTEAVRRQSRSHLGIGCEVSGGIDSSSVFAVAHALDRQGSLGAPDLAGYSLHFGDGSPADEIEFARAVGAHLGRPIEEIPPALEPLDWYREWVARYRDFPHYPNTVMGHSINRAARGDGRRVVLTGFGGDEWQMGSPFYLVDFLRQGSLGRLMSAVRQEARAFGWSAALRRAGRFGPFALLPQAIQAPILRYRRRARPPAGFRLSPRLAALHEARRRARAPDPGDIAAPRHAVSFQTLHAPTRAQTRESFDHLAASVGIEKRDPMTATSVVEFHFRTPDWIRQTADEFRICHRLAVADNLPEVVLHRANKAEFSSTIRDLVDVVLSQKETSVAEVSQSWLSRGEINRVQQLARESDSGISTLWAIWGLFSCALLAR